MQHAVKDVEDGVLHSGRTLLQHLQKSKAEDAEGRRDKEWRTLKIEGMRRMTLNTKETGWRMLSIKGMRRTLKIKETWDGGCKE